MNRRDEGKSLKERGEREKEKKDLTIQTGRVGERNKEIGADPGKRGKNG